jgi:hypothetical protein
VIHGEYNAERYTIYSDGVEIYTAGNSPYDSQAYVSADDGVGLERMGEFCRGTAAELATERGEPLGECEETEPDDV